MKNPQKAQQRSEKFYGSDREEQKTFQNNSGKIKCEIGDEEKHKQEVGSEEAVCAGCNLPQNEWSTEREGQYSEGYWKKGFTYCCEGCAEGFGCTCPTGKNSFTDEDTSSRT